MMKNKIILLGNVIIFLLCIINQLIFAWLSINDIIWIIFGIFGSILGSASLFQTEDKISVIIGFGFLFLPCYIYILWLYLIYYNLFSLYGIWMAITILAIIGIIYSIVIIGYLIHSINLLELPEIPINLNLSILNAIIFITCITVQLVYAWLSIYDSIWIIVGGSGIFLGFISLFVFYNKKIAGLGFGFIMLFSYSYLLWLYLVYYNLFALYGINMPIIYSGIGGIVCSTLIIIKFFLDKSNYGFPKNPVNKKFSLKKDNQNLLIIVEEGITLFSTMLGFVSTIISFFF
ncbi:MAG: hypothetical protein ACTSWE_08845 [Promethearchaeota archaeon]